MGQAAFGKAVLDRLRSDGVTVAAVSTPEPSGGAVDPLWEEGERRGLPLVRTTALKTADGIEQWKHAGIDLCVMAFVTEYLPQEVFTVPTLGTIQYHPSLLPAHRGQSAMNWAIINGETQTGLCVFWPDEGLDTGPLLLTKQCEIRPDDTLGSLYFERLFPLGVDAVAEAVTLVADGNAPQEPQDHALATYEPPCGDKHAQIRWHEPARRVYDLIRGCDPQPGAWTRFEDERLRLYGCQLVGERRAGMPGEVLDIDGGGFTIRLNGDLLRVGRVKVGEARKTDAAEWAAQVGLTIGYRFRG
ncbi:MAG: methionyl-tRNA formyltransferase [Nocardioidaceae bacterium]